VLLCNLLYVPSMLELLALITPFIALAVSTCVIYSIRFLDVVEREPKRIVVLAMVLGAVSTVPVIVFGIFAQMVFVSLGFSAEAFPDFTTILISPFAEELVKLIALIALFILCRSNFNALTDFLVYACAIAIGFELIENIIYLWSALGGQDQSDAWINEFNGRTILSAGMHAFFSIWLGFGLWVFLKGKTVWNRLLALAIFGLSICLHTFNNLFAVMSKLGPADQILPINRLGATLGAIFTHFELALFISLIGVAVLSDIHILNNFGFSVQEQLFRLGRVDKYSDLYYLKLLTNPINHVFAGSAWSWSFIHHDEKKPPRTIFRTYAMLAFNFSNSNIGSNATNRNEESSHDVTKAIFLIDSLT